MGVSVRHSGGMTIAGLRDKLGSIGGGNVRGELNAALGAKGMQLVDGGFKETRDPYGNVWDPIGRLQNIKMKRGMQGPRVRRGKPLIKTGHLRASLSMQVLPDGFRLGMAAEYAKFHQFGTPTIARRQMIPDRATGGLGPIWTEALGVTGRGVLKKFGKGRS